MTKFNNSTGALKKAPHGDIREQADAGSMLQEMGIEAENVAASVIPFPSDSPVIETIVPVQADPVVIPEDAQTGLGGLDAKLDAEAERAITEMLQRAQANGSQVACLWFRAGEHGMIEESFGRQVGRELLGMVEGRLRQSLRDTDLLYSVTSNEFVILLDDVNEDTSRAVAERLLSRCNGIYQIDEMRLYMKGNVGIALFPENAAKPHRLLRYARLALREIDPKQTTQWQYFSPARLSQMRDRASMTAELVDALEQGRLVLHYQPQYAIDTQQVVGVEALVRMVSRSGDLVGPSYFIDLAEETGLILPLGRWVIQQACRQLGRWRKAGLGHLRMAINVSPQQLRDDDLIEIIDQAVVRNGIQHSDLELEITENQIVEHMQQAEQALRKLIDRGVRIAVDDFGTGYSSLAYLMQLSVDTVKIDRAFMQRLPGDDRTARIVNAVIGMAREMGIALTAEGIETEAQHQFLLEAGCEVGQGFGFAKPQSAEYIERFLF